MSGVAIKITNISKDFSFSRRKAVTIKSAFTGAMKRKTKGEKAIQHALQDVGFEIQEGEFFGIVGRNGSGKSTLLKILAGIYQPNKGSVSVRGKLVPFIELGVGFNPELTGRENVYLNGALLGFSEKEVDQFYDEVVEFAELEQFMDKKLKNYSSGMQVRLAFSMAIRAKADILLIDEVLAVGDADFQRKCFNYFKQLKKEHTTVVLVTHDMDAVREYCDRAALIESSKVAMVGDPDKIAKEYIKLFAANASENSQGNRWGDGSAKTESVKADITNSTIKITQTIQEVQEQPDGKRFVLGIRIRGADGRGVAGTNTKIEGVVLPAAGKGVKRTVTWQLPNVFSDGSYLVDLAVQDEDALTTHDWWDEAVRFSVSKARKIPYVVDPGFEVKVK